MNIVQTIREETQAFADKIAVVEPERSITYRQLLTDVQLVAKRMTGAGIASGHRIGFHCRDGIDYIIGSLALLDAGAAVVPLADSLTPAEFTETVDRIDLNGVVTQSEMRDNPGGTPFHPSFNFTARHADASLDHRCREMNLAFIRFSSGTTGVSKGVALSHQSIVERTDAANRGLGVTNADRILWVLSMSHHFVVSILLFLRRAATIVVANREFPWSLLEAAVCAKPTFIYASPMHYHLLGVSDSVTPEALSGVRLAVSTAMRMPPAIAENFAAKFGFAPAEAYGIIEVGLPFVNIEARSTGRGTVGRALPDYELRIANADANGIGDVLLRGKGMFDAYVSPWRMREECLDDGWFHTGDLGRLDEAGRLCLLGRTKTVIISAGMKVFPEEVEAIINAVPGVRESLVCGQEHPQLGQVPIAMVVADANEALTQRIRAACAEKLSSYMIPAEVRFVPSLPKTPSGKLSRTL